MDPQVISILLEKNFFSDFAANLIFVPEKRVISDPLARIPFSKGVNLILSIPKKHLNNHPHLKTRKTASQSQKL